MNRKVCWMAAALGFVAASSAMAQELTLRSVLRGNAGVVDCVAFSPDRTTLVGVCDSTLALWNVRNGKSVASWDAASSVASVAFSPDGKTVASATYCGGTVELWEVATGRNLLTLSDQGAVRKTVAFSPDGKTLASTSDEGSIVLYDIATGERRAALVDRQLNYPMAYAPDGKTLATAYGRTEATHYSSVVVALWDLTIEKPRATLNGHSGNITSLAFSPDGKMLASGSEDRTIRCWDLALAKSIATYTGHRETVTSIAFSPDSRTLASGSADKTIRLWDVASGRDLATVQGHTGRVNAVAFSLDGSILASGSEDGTIRLWEIKSRWHEHASGANKRRRWCPQSIFRGFRQQKGDSIPRE